MDFLAAAVLLDQVAQLLAGDALAANASHLARACQLRSRQEVATIRLDIPPRTWAQITVRQEGGEMVMIHQETGERRRCSLEDFVHGASVEQAWRVAGCYALPT